MSLKYGTMYFVCRASHGFHICYYACAQRKLKIDVKPYWHKYKHACKWQNDHVLVGKQKTRVCTRASKVKLQFDLWCAHAPVNKMSLKSKRPLVSGSQPVCPFCFPFIHTIFRNAHVVKPGAFDYVTQGRIIQTLHFTIKVVCCIKQLSDVQEKYKLTVKVAKEASWKYV